MLAQKANKVYRIPEGREDAYLKDGYDIYNDKGELVKRSPLTKVAYAEYEKLLNENAELKAKVAELEAAAEKKLDKKGKEAKVGE